MKNKIRGLFTKIENAPAVSAVREGLVMIIPVVMIGSFSLVIRYFPIDAYQQFIENVLNGLVWTFFTGIYNATFGMLSVFLTLTISFCYCRNRKKKAVSIAEPITSLICFFVLSGVVSSGKWEALGVKGMFVAIVSSLLATKLYGVFFSLINKNHRQFRDGTAVTFNESVSMIFPALAVVAIFTLFNTAVMRISGNDSFFDLFENAANAMFIPLGRSFISAILMVMVTSILWFFGIHGSNVLEAVMEKVFTPAIYENVALVAQGKVPTEIFTKQFFDVFILMGGCGTAICLLISILLFSKRKSNRRLSHLAAVPMLFNINELMIFGFPIIFNPVMLIPFILTPLFCFFTTYAAMSLGLVPLITSEVNWTAPVFINGYIATGSIAGSLLQLFNITAGVFIYRPFILMYDRHRNKIANRQLSELVDILVKSEETVTPITLTELSDEHGSMARFLVSDLRLALDRKELNLHYQPQYNNKSVCVGVEALLRWNHPNYGMIYPPLVIQLARESHMLTELETLVLQTAVDDMKIIREQTGYKKEIGVNVSSETIQSDEYIAFLRSLMDSHSIEKGEICLEITEQTALLSTESTFARLDEIKKLGYRLAIDDFSMGHTSLTYLQEGQFDIVKLDGSLVKGMKNNPRCIDIIKSITELSHSLGFLVIAEFVEVEEQAHILEGIGCTQYQGWLFSPAINRSALINRFNAENVKITERTLK